MNDELKAYREQYSYYAQKLLSELGLGAVAQPERGRLLASIEQYIGQILTNTLLESLSDEHLDQVELLLEEGKTQEDVVVFLLDTVPDMQLRVAEAFVAAYDRILEDSQALRKAITAAPAGADDKSR